MNSIQLLSVSGSEVIIALAILGICYGQMHYPYPTEHKKSMVKSTKLSNQNQWGV